MNSLLLLVSFGVLLVNFKDLLVNSLFIQYQTKNRGQ
ncbi:hypothetical protein ABIE66_004427 [Peribacillus sp. B2I2]